MTTGKALLVGINYIGTSNKLYGCINDVNNMKSYLLEHNYTEDDIQILTDETPDKPTKKNILNSLFQLVISDSNRLFFHYSGHGTRISDTNGDEADKNDEAIVPLDFAKEGIIKDNHYVETPGNVTLFSGCMDAQYSADTFEDGQAQGAMTCCLLRVLPKAKNLLELLLLLRQELERSGYKQTAFLSSGKASPLHSAVNF